jgi:glycogen debranching enzyme
MRSLGSQSSPSSPRQLSPRGEEFEVAGRAGPVELMRAPPIPAEARAELLVIKSGRVFLCARPTGDVRPGTVSGEGLYAKDTRYLSELHLTFGALEPVLLSHTVDAGYRAVVDATNPTLAQDDGLPVAQETLNLRRTFLLAAGCLYCRVELRNYCPRAVTAPLTLALAADFADVFEIRGVRERTARGQAMVPNARGSSVTFGYEGQDRVFRETRVDLDPPPDTTKVDDGRAVLCWRCSLAPRQSQVLLVTVIPADGEERRARGRRSFSQASRDAEDGLEQLRGGCTQVESDSEPLQSVLGAAVRDLHALITPVEGGRIPAAGIPWYVAPFGRDSLLCAYEALMLDPSIARETLIVLAHWQAHADEPWRDAEPGKILHELRTGELARAGLVPHTPYYGTVDATPLFVMLAAAYHRWTADTATLSALRPAIDSALEWIDRYGDIDGDGFIEYQRRSPAGLSNQGWKDSDDAVVHADGTRASGPIALVEAQGYVYMAKLEIADVYDALGDGERAGELRSQARALREAFNEAFWNPQEGTFALALDGQKRQVTSVTSNPGHCLFCGIVEPDKAAAVAERLMAPDMFSGWGVRTLSSKSPAYNPMSYHNGSIWPHDNAIIAAGLKRYDLASETQRIATAILDIATRARDFRLAELYCGFERDQRGEIVAYPVACMPQAWAAAVPFMLLQAMLGLAPNAPSDTLTVVKPTIPSWLGYVELHALSVGQADVSLAFTRTDGTTGFSLLSQHGQIAVTMSAMPH